MKKFLFLTILCLLINGCTQDQFSIEKEFWQIRKKSEKIFKNPASSPPNELTYIIGLYKNFIKKHSKNILTIESEFNIAKLYIVKEEHTKARIHLNNILRTYQKYPVICSEAIFLIGNSYQIQNKWISALEQYKKIIKTYPLTKRGFELPIYITAYYKSKLQPDKRIMAFNEAIAHYTVLANKYPKTPLALKCYEIITSCYLEMKKFPEAILTLETVLTKFAGKIQPEPILLNEALLYKNALKDTPKAIATLERIIKEYPKSKMVESIKTLIKKINEEKKK